MFPELFEDGDGHGDRGRGEDGAVEQPREDARFGEEDERGEGAQPHGDDDAERGDDDGRDARLPELFEIGAEARGEHDEDDADLAHDVEHEFDLFAEEGGLQRLPRDIAQEPDEDPCGEHADDGRHPAFVCPEPHQLGEKEDEGEGE